MGLEENTRKGCLTLVLAMTVDMNPKAETTNEKVNQWDSMELIRFHKETTVQCIITQPSGLVPR